MLSPSESRLDLMKIHSGIAPALTSSLRLVSLPILGIADPRSMCDHLCVACMTGKVNRATNIKTLPNTDGKSSRRTYNGS